MSQSTSQASCHDPLDSMVDFSEYDKLSYQSPTVSPSTSKSQFISRPVSNTPASLPATQPGLSGPSHNYDMYKQQTGIPQGAVASTLAVNSQMNYGFSEGYLSGFDASGDDLLDFGSAPGSVFTTSDMDMDTFSPKQEPAFFYPESPEFINPQTTLSVPAVQPTQSNAGRVWPGMHQQQAALAKAQAQQKQQQQIIQQQRASGSAPRQRARGSQQPTDPIVEEKISQLLNSMRHSSVGSDESSGGNMSHVQRMRKDEEDMDEDERLLASEEGKKLSSKERRQLRNKVSARAFRSRRKGQYSQPSLITHANISQNTSANSKARSQPKSTRTPISAPRTAH